MAPWSDDEDELQDWEYPEADEHRESESDMIVCPNCRADIFDDVEQCPRCHHYILDAELHRSASATRWGWWGLVMVLLVLLMLVWASIQAG